ncbi:glycosyltransferase family 4 protein [Candidatus Nitrospira bockiana]
MHALRILHTEPSTGLGGQEFRTLAEAAGMAARGHEVVLAVPPGSALETLARTNGVRVEPLRFTPLRYPQLVFEFRTLIARCRIDVVNSHGSIDSWTAAIGARMAAVRPLILRTRHKSTPVRASLRNRLLYGRLADGIITTGDAVRADLMSRLGVSPERIVSIPTGVDLARYRPMPADPAVRAEFGLASHHLVIGTVAFLRDYKGVEYFVTAAVEVRRRHPQARFLIVGDGPEKARITASIRDQGCSDTITVTGFRDDVPRLLAAMDVCVLASVGGEGVPQAVTQALAMKRAVVATDVGSVREVAIHGHTALIVPPRDSAALAREITRLIDEPALRTRLGEAGHDLITKAYSQEHMLARTEELYRRLLETTRLAKSGTADRR